jgi:putative ABC transport system ATP-binding protein
MVRLRDGEVEVDQRNENIVKASDPTHRYNQE